MAYTANGQWGLPLEETSSNVRPMGSRRDTSGSHERGQSGNRDSNLSRRGPNEPWNIMSDSEGTKQRRQSVKANNAGASRKRSRNTLREKKTEKPVERVDDSAWIHRDKLAQIEIMEMEAAGIPVRQSRRSVSAGAGAERRRSRSQSRSRKGVPKDEEQEEMPSDAYGNAYGGDEDYERKRMSAIPAADEEEHYDPNVDYEFRTPEEVAAEHDPKHTIRPSTSRIPVSKASPVPVPSTVVDRDSPLPRSRHGSTSGTWDEMQYQRKARSGSIGSQAILNDDDGLKTPPRPGSSQMRSSDENSPPKSRLPNAGPNGRKTSTPTSNGVQRPGSSHGNKSRTASNNTKDRVASNGHKSRPSTSHAYNPEGDPPWISSMYKPDPRLPPDQQMLPTHAKRMMQEQWEREGKSGTTYDRDLRLISDEPLPSPTERKPSPLPPPLNLNNTRFEPAKVPSPSRTPNLEVPSKSPTSPNTTNMHAWPLTPESERKSEPTSPRPGTSGGLKLTPTIQSPPQIHRAENSPSREKIPVERMPVERMPELDEKAEAEPKKGCCCVVM